MDMQNVSNLQIPEGKVRTIHDKDNRLIWGRLNYDTKYAGDAYQQTYSGKNLFKCPNSVTTTNTTFTRLGDNAFTAEFTKTSTSSQSAFTKVQVSGLQPNTTYTASYDFDVTGTNWTNAGKVRTQIDGTWSSQFYTNRITFTTNATTDDVWLVFSNAQGVTTTGSNSINFTNIQVEVGSQPTPYEPFTAGPAPNPDYPQDVQVVTGEQNVWVHGKNLWDSDNVLDGVGLNTDGTTYAITNRSTLDYTIVSASQSYVIIGATVKQACFYDASKTFVGRAPSSSTSFTTTSDTKYIRVSFDNTLSYNDAQLEKGSTATTYEPYQSQTYPISLGSIELCKIGNYQDYIYKSGDDWYVYKEVKKVSLTGTTGWWESTHSIKNTLAGAGLSDIVVQSSWNIMPIALSDYFVPRKVSDIYNGNVNNGFGLVSDGCYFADNDWDLATFTSFITNNDVHVYGALVTPINTKIVDSTLIGQLNAVHQWLTRYGYNATVSGNLPLIVDRTNL